MKTTFKMAMILPAVIIAAFFNTAFGQCSVNVFRTNDSCNLKCDGTARVTFSTGTAPYTYLWSPVGATTSAISNLCAGTYTCLQTDAVGCTATRTVSITQPAALGVNVTVTAATSCGPCDGKATAAVTGGTTGGAGYPKYLWSPGGATTATVTGLCAGNYTVTATDRNLCTATTTVNVGGPVGPTAQLTSTNVSCNAACDGTASATVSGGTTPYTYSWAPSTATTSALTGLCAGTVTVTVSDAGG
ncbi:MAG TPA: SprB repeat-containing protein, partial [Bacteroidia bacterium]